MLACSHTSVIMCERTSTFYNFRKMDHFLRVRLAQRLSPLPISHLSPISLGMNVCIMVCWMCVCVFALLQMSLFIDG